MIAFNANLLKKISGHQALTYNSNDAKCNSERLKLKFRAKLGWNFGMQQVWSHTS